MAESYANTISPGVISYLVIHCSSQFSWIHAKPVASCEVKTKLMTKPVSHLIEAYLEAYWVIYHVIKF